MHRRFVFRLFVTGQTGRSERAIASLRRICEQALDGECEIIIVDVLESPHLAEQARVLATPTVIREFPPPVRRVIGDLTDAQQVALALGLARQSETPPMGGVNL